MNPEDLKSARSGLEFSQPEMAQFLKNTPLKTYRNWEQGISPVPNWVSEFLVPDETLIGGLSLQDIGDLAKVATTKKMSMRALLADYVRAGLKGTITIVLFGLIAWQTFTPQDHPLVRKIGGRRRTEDVASMDFLDGGEG